MSRLLDAALDFLDRALGMDTAEPMSLDADLDEPDTAAIDPALAPEECGFCDQGRRLLGDGSTIECFFCNGTGIVHP